MDSHAAEHVMDGQSEPTNEDLVQALEELIELHEKLNREHITQFIATYNAAIIGIVVVVRAALIAA